MKIQEVKEAVATVRMMADQNDHEGAHGAEDALYQAVLKYLARGGCPSVFHARNVAIEALKTQDIKFDRFTA